MEEKYVFTGEELRAFTNECVKAVKDRCPNGSIEFEDLYGEIDENNLTIRFKGSIVLPVDDLDKLYFSR